MVVAASDIKLESLLSLKGKTAVLTAASGFLGRTFCRALLTNGARVVALGRSERLDAEAARWTGEFDSGSVAVERIGMYDVNALNTVCETIATREKRIDVLINNAQELGAATGFNVPEGSLENSTFDQWQRNLQGGVYWAADDTTDRRTHEGAGGRVARQHRPYASVAPPAQLHEGTSSFNPPGYSASKAALVAAGFWGAFGVRANCISPGPFSNTEDVAGPQRRKQPKSWSRPSRRAQAVVATGKFSIAGLECGHRGWPYRRLPLLADLRSEMVKRNSGSF